jgi:hypothetical protein
MRDYSKVCPQFWIGKTGKKLRASGQEAQIVGMYLMTSPHSNMLGLYYLSLNSIAHETGLGIKSAQKGLKGCIDSDFCSYDEETEMLWVHEMAFYQIADALIVKDKRIAGVQNEYNALPDNPHLPKFFEKYAAAFQMTKKRGNDSQIIPFEAPSKPLRSQEQEQEHNQEQEQEQSIVEKNHLDQVVSIFDFWKKVMNSEKSVLDAKRTKLIKSAIEKYSPADICIAIRGCSKSAYHMGDNNQKTKYNGLNLILRDAEYIDKFMQLDNGKASAGSETVEQRNARIIAEFCGDSVEDNDIIEMEM